MNKIIKESHENIIKDIESQFKIAVLISEDWKNLKKITNNVKENVLGILNCTVFKSVDERRKKISEISSDNTKKEQKIQYNKEVLEIRKLSYKISTNFDKIYLNNIWKISNNEKKILEKFREVISWHWELRSVKYISEKDKIEILTALLDFSKEDIFWKLSWKDLLSLTNAIKELYKNWINKLIEEDDILWYFDDFSKIWLSKDYKTVFRLLISLFSYFDIYYEEISQKINKDIEQIQESWKFNKKQQNTDNFKILAYSKWWEKIIWK